MDERMDACMGGWVGESMSRRGEVGRWVVGLGLFDLTNTFLTSASGWREKSIMVRG